MAEPIAYLNSEWIPFSATRLSVADSGVVQGATVTEMVRTFGFRPFRVDEHLARLRQSLTLTGIADPAIADTLPMVIENIVRQNSPLIPCGHDLGVVICVTAGPLPMYAGLPLDSPVSPSVCVHTFPLPFERWANRYDQGVLLRVPSVRAMSSSTINPQIKHRSRLHWFLADREVQRDDPAAWALLLDEQGRVTETNSGNLILFDGECLRIPPPEGILDGISQQVVMELAEAAGISHMVEPLLIADIKACREAFLSSTTYCLLPVTRLNGETIGGGKPGPVYARLIKDWSALVGTDIIFQARQAAGARSP